MDFPARPKQVRSELQDFVYSVEATNNTALFENQKTTPKISSDVRLFPVQIDICLFPKIKLALQGRVFDDVEATKNKSAAVRSAGTGKCFLRQNYHRNR